MSTIYDISSEKFAHCCLCNTINAYQNFHLVRILRTLMLQNYLYDNLHMKVLYAGFRCPDLYRAFSFDLALVLSCLVGRKL